MKPKAPAGTKPVKKTEVKPQLSVDRGSDAARLKFWQVTLTALAFATRFYRISWPDQVVFDEVHFGKFASYYLQGTYFFDLHPPFAKIMIAMVGKLIGYDGSFLFDTIGLSYITSSVPYVAYRSWCALQGALVVPVLFETLKDCGLSVAGCVVGSAIVLLDNAQVTETRLILLDATLVFTIAASICSYVKFVKQRHNPWGLKWWFWLMTTGFWLSCVISTKYVGVFTFLMVGAAVAADLYYLLDARQGLSLKRWGWHFAARAWSLIVFPFLIYLFWFWAHFQLLPNSGPGDGHMSTSFLEGLGANPLVAEAMNINYFDTVTIQSNVGNLFLHSHLHNYPVHYPDGRVSTGGQQVTAYTPQGGQDPNNLWQILPEDPNIQYDPNLEMPVLGSDNVIRLRHVNTNTYLLTHDVASPSFPTNEEFTVVPEEFALGDQFGNTLFRLHLPKDKDQAVRTKLTKFRLDHVNTKVAMWMSDTKLPEWGFGQIEINGNKNFEDPKSLWYFGDITSVEDKDSRRRSVKPDSEKPKRSFFSKYLELQGLMFESNNNLKETHPYQSSPLSWPFLIKGISFWSDKEDRSQIYLLGNFVGYYFELTCFVLFVLIVFVDQATQLRQYPLLTPYSRNKLYRTLLWFFLGWFVHYAPFFLMGRQLFLHHYMPAHMVGALLCGGLVDLVFGQLDYPGKRKPSLPTVCFTVTFLSGLIWCFQKFSPLVYGLPLNVDQVKSLEWFKTVLHFNK